MGAPRARNFAMRDVVQALVAFAAAAAALTPRKAGRRAPASAADEPRCAEESCALRQLWLDYNESHAIDRIFDHAGHYQKHLPARSGAGPVRMLEIGVQSGGSARAWKQWFGPRLYYAGVDVEPRCKRTESPAEGLFVEIGSQLNATFLHEVCRKHGPFDVIIDDAAHRAEFIVASLRALWPTELCMKSRGLYVVEDTETMVAGPKFHASPADMYNIVGEAFWSMHHLWATVSASGKSTANFGGDGQALHPIFKDLVSAVYAYPTIFFLERGRTPKSREERRGWDVIPYGRGAPLQQRRKQEAQRRKNGRLSRKPLHA